MDLLRAIRNLVTRTKANEPPGIKFNKADRTLQAKLVLVGDNGAGKPSLVWSLHRKEPCTRIEPLPFGSTNNEHYEVETDTPRGHVRIDLWDAWAHIDYDQIRAMIYKDMGIVAFVFGIDNADSLSSIQERWLDEVNRCCLGVPSVVIGCKSDLPAEVNTEAGISLATRIGARHYIECSPQKYVGIEEVLECVANMAWELYQNKKSKRRFELSVTLPSEDEP
ncbi:GTP-binding protein Rho1 [Ceratobasidium sp. 428]|nr:GTP-binding protein Rho1 [Ceratobasidium sp. 428]